MKDLAPDIVRQRLLIEGYYSIDVDRHVVAAFLYSIADRLALRSYGSAVVHAPQGEGSEGNAGFDAFLPLIDSGISLYVWTRARFFALVLFTCKRFDVDTALAFTREYFGAAPVVHRAF